MRRMEINVGNSELPGILLVSSIIERWPALKMKNYVRTFRISIFKYVFIYGDIYNLPDRFSMNSST